MKYEDLLKKTMPGQFDQINARVLKRKTAVWGVGCCLIIVLIVGGFIAGLTYFLSVHVEETKQLSSDPENFNPVSSYTEVQEHAGSNTQLVSLSTYYVRSDGTMNLNADYTPGPRAEYEFYKILDQPPENAPPIGAGSTIENIWYEPITVSVYKPWQTRHVKKIGGGFSTEYSYVNLGMDRESDDPRSGEPDQAVNEPQCDFSELWNTAIQQGAPKNAVANIEYTVKGYEFRIQNTDFRFEFDQACNLIQS